jgi:hypothetical protein
MSVNVENPVATIPERKPRKARRLLRRIGKLALWAVGLGFTYFVSLTAYYSWAYDVSLVKAGKGVVRETALRVARAALWVYNPCPVKKARLGPAQELGPEYVRLEEFLANAADPRLVKFEVQNQRITYAQRPFGYQPYDEPRLHELRSKYNLDQLIADAPTEFEKVKRLQSWCRSQFRRRDYQPTMPNFDVLLILDRNLRNDSDKAIKAEDYDPCHFFPMFLCQAGTSLGFNFRLLSSSNHGSTEFWSNQFGKWVYLDAEYNHHLERNGVPLSAVEVVDASFTDASDIRIVRGRQTADPEVALAHLHRHKLEVSDVLPWFKQGFQLVDLRNDWMTNHYFPGHPARSDFNSLVYHDPRANPPRMFDKRLRPVTCYKDDLLWTLNQVEIQAHALSEDGILHLGFRTVTPNFAHFEVEGNGTEKFTTEQPTFAWRLRDGENRLAIRTQNQFGMAGIVSSAAITWRGPKTK